MAPLHSSATPPVHVGVFTSCPIFFAPSLPVCLHTGISLGLRKNDLVYLASVQRWYIRPRPVFLQAPLAGLFYPPFFVAAPLCIIVWTRTT